MRLAAAIVFAKEMRDALRDRRTALAVFVASILTGPLTLALVGHYVSSLDERAEVRKVRMAGRAHAAPLVNFLERNDVEIEAAPANYEELIREGRVDAVIVVPEDFDERYLAGDHAGVEIVYDDSRTEALPAIRQAERLLRAFNRETGMLRMVARGVSPDLAEPVKVDHVNTASTRQKGAPLLFLVTMFAMLSPLLGAMAVAIDSTAGERERGSLEPLLGNPVRIGALVAGKWLAAWAFGAGVAFLTLAGFVLATQWIADSRISRFMVFGLPELARFCAVVAPLAAMCAALQMLICTYGRSYREAQTYVSYLASVVLAVPVVVTMTGLREAAWQVAIPVLGQQMALNRIVRGQDLSAVDYALPAIVAFAVGAAALAAVARLLRDERIVFGRS